MIKSIRFITATTLIAGAVIGTGAGSVSAAQTQCSMTIDSEIHTFSSPAEATGDCEGLVQGYYTPYQDAYGITGSYTGRVTESGQKFDIPTPKTLEGTSVLTVTTIDSSKDPVEPKPETKPEGLTDIKGHWAEKEIQYLTGLGLINGYRDGSFKPDKDITRAEVTKVIVDELGIGGAYKYDFSDIAGHWAKESIHAAAAKRVVNGYTNGTFQPDESITRAEVSSILVRAYELKSGTGSGAGSFKDLESQKWYYKDVSTMIDNQLVNGYGDGSFKPEDSVTRAEFAAFLKRTIE
ncbi:S-layer homology domain-containing protein [Halobacillus salinus]|uniref:S-layer homology domain-containing protein n=1 Tax=Halobacillus salinus TaxID=192814 RepID=UPI0009A66D33|nr:S-layer homology domain-containing protein [Halobacillus salinus]